MEQELNQAEQPREETSEVTSTEETPTSQEPRTYTEEEWRTLQGKADKRTYESEQKANKAMADLAQMKEDYEFSVKQQQELQVELERKEDQSLEGDQEALSAAKIRRQATKATRELAKKERDIARREAALGGVMREQAISGISRQYGVEPEVLKFATSYEEAELVAKTIQQEREKLLGKGKPKTSPEAKSVPKYDTGISTASGRAYSREWLKNASTEELIAHEKEIDKAFKEGRIS